MNKCDWMPNLALFSQFVTNLGRIVHHSPSSQSRETQEAQSIALCCPLVSLRRC